MDAKWILFGKRIEWIHRREKSPGNYRYYSNPFTGRNEILEENIVNQKNKLLENIEDNDIKNNKGGGGNIHTPSTDSGGNIKRKRLKLRT